MNPPEPIAVGSECMEAPYRLRSPSISPLLSRPVMVNPESNYISRLRNEFRFSSIRTWWCSAYIIDIIVSLILCIIATLMESHVDPTCRHLVMPDADLELPYATVETVSSVELVVYSAVVGWVTACVVGLFYASLHHWFAAGVSFFLAMAFTYITTFGLKVFAGAYRPDFLDRMSLATSIPPSAIPLMTPAETGCGTNMIAPATIERIFTLHPFVGAPGAAYVPAALIAAPLPTPPSPPPVAPPADPVAAGRSAVAASITSNTSAATAPPAAVNASAPAGRASASALPSSPTSLATAAPATSTSTVSQPASSTHLRASDVSNTTPSSSSTGNASRKVVRVGGRAGQVAQGPRLALVPVVAPAKVERMMRSGRRSFPSGHSSTAMGTSVVCALTLRRMFRDVFRTAAFRALALSCVLAFGFWVGATRITDYRHHYVDVIAGWGVGAFWGVIAHVMYYYIGGWDEGSTADLMSASAVIRVAVPWARAPKRRLSVFPDEHVEDGLVSPVGGARSPSERRGSGASGSAHPSHAPLQGGYHLGRAAAAGRVGHVDLDGHPRLLKMRWDGCACLGTATPTGGGLGSTPEPANAVLGGGGTPPGVAPPGYVGTDMHSPVISPTSAARACARGSSDVRL